MFWRQLIGLADTVVFVMETILLIVIVDKPSRWTHRHIGRVVVHKERIITVDVKMVLPLGQLVGCMYKHSIGPKWL